MPANPYQFAYRHATLLWVAAACLLPVGCAVPQKPGLGKAIRRVEATTKNPYWLYLPKGYLENAGQHPDGRRYPIVVTFHGMRPFDDYGAHIKQWQQEADRYGLIVIAPRLHACDVSQPFPINRVTAAVQRDERATLAILDEVCRLTNAEPNLVLSTSFSSGGYLAHYMVNRHPSRFSCIAVFQSNFAAEILDPGQVPQYRDYPIAILSGENDLGVTRKESAAAINWYTRHGFKVIARKLLTWGHERTPEAAAIIFADSAQLKANSPPPLNKYRVFEFPPSVPRGRITREPDANLVMRSAGRPVGSVAAAGSQAGGDLGSVLFGERATEKGNGDRGNGRPAAENGAGKAPNARGHRTKSRRNDQIKITTVPGPRQGRSSPPMPTPLSKAQRLGRRTASRNGNLSRRTTERPAVARIRINSTIGLPPHLISFAADIPDALKKNASCIWLLNNVTICKGFTGQKILATPGEHTLSVLILTRDNQELRNSTQVTVLKPR